MLRQKLKQADILVLKQASLADRRQEALEEQAKLEPRIDLLAAQIKELQKLVLYPFKLIKIDRKCLSQSILFLFVYLIRSFGFCKLILSHFFIIQVNIVFLFVCLFVFFYRLKLTFQNDITCGQSILWEFMCNLTRNFTNKYFISLK